MLEGEDIKLAREVVVPSLTKDIITALRQIGQPIRLFGEQAYDVRSRLRHFLIQKAAAEDVTILPEYHLEKEEAEGVKYLKPHKESPAEISYTQGTPELRDARQDIFRFSVKRTTARLQRESKSRRTNAKRTELYERNGGGADDVGTPSKRENDLALVKLHQSTRRLGLEGSQIGDTRTLSCVCSLMPGGPLVATGGWSGTLKVWNAQNVEEMISKPLAHQNRIMGIASSAVASDYDGNTSCFCTTSLDLTAKLWKLTVHRDLKSNETDFEEMKGKRRDLSDNLVLEPAGTLSGHGSRLCRAAFHPNGRHVITTSFDHTWRMWDVERSQQLLIQDSGHDRETFGVGIHPDGSLVAITDFAGVVRLWDLRSGKAVHHFLGHAKRVLCAEFHQSGGFQLSTAGDDGTIRVWDIRQRSMRSTLPAHSNIITQLRYLPFESREGAYNRGEILASASFDKTIKLWRTRDWKVLSTLKGHEGNVTGVDFVTKRSEKVQRTKEVPTEDLFQVVSCGFDKTLKVWKEQKGMIL